MAGFTLFNEGAAYLNQNGWPPVVYFLLSTRSPTNFDSADTLRGGLGEITGPGYKRAAQARPPSISGNMIFGPIQWDVTARGWPTDVRSLIAATTPENSGAAICAWQLSQTRDMSAIGRTLTITPSFHS